MCGSVVAVLSCAFFYMTHYQSIWRVCKDTSIHPAVVASVVKLPSMPYPCRLLHHLAQVTRKLMALPDTRFAAAGLTNTKLQVRVGTKVKIEKSQSTVFSLESERSVRENQSK